MTTLDGKTALVTGGGRGIGRTTVDRLLLAGANLVTCGRGERPDDLAPDVIWVQGDVAQPRDARRIMDAVQTR